MSAQDHITLKWGTLKAWHLHSEKGQELLKRYFAIGSSASAMLQHDTPEQKDLICQMIDDCNAPTIFLDWDGIDVSKDEAKRYVMEYGKQDRRDEGDRMSTNPSGSAAPTKTTAQQRAEGALSSSQAFCGLLAQARQFKAPGWWEGSAFRDHPCGLIVGTVKLTNYWHVDNLCDVEITNGEGWDRNVSQDSFSHASPHPKPINGKSVRAWRCGKWQSPVFEESLRPLLLEILTKAAEHVEAASKALADAEAEAKRQRELEQAAIVAAAIAAATAGAQGAQA